MSAYGSPPMSYVRLSSTSISRTAPSSPTPTRQSQFPVCSCSRRQDGKLTPVDVTADKLTYVDAERRARYSGNVFVKSPTGTVSAQQIDIYLKPADAGDCPTQPPQARTPCFPGYRRSQPSRPHGGHRQGCGHRTEPPRSGRAGWFTPPTTPSITLPGKPPAFLMPNTARYGAIR